MDTSVWKLLSFWIKQLPWLHPQIRFHEQEANPSAILTPIRFRRSTQQAIPIFTPHIAYLPQHTRTLIFIIQLWNQRCRGLSWVTCSKPPYIKRHSYITTHLITIFFFFFSSANNILNQEEVPKLMRATKLIQEEVSWLSWYILFVDDMVIVDEIRHGINVQIEIWWDTFII